MVDCGRRAFNQHNRQSPINNQSPIKDRPINNALYLTQPAGAPARRASSWILVMFVVCSSISFLVRSRSESALSRSPAILARCCGSSRLTKSVLSALMRLCSASAKLFARSRRSRSFWMRSRHWASSFLRSAGSALTCAGLSVLSPAALSAACLSPDLSPADLSAADLSAADLSAADLSADLSVADDEDDPAAGASEDGEMEGDGSGLILSFV